VSDALGLFSAPTREWFGGAFAAPTAAQLGAWDAISHGHHTLVVAPTGSGKTLAAFLWAIDDALELGRPDRRRADAPSTRVLYISPLKALAVDVERNLRAPLTGIAQTARRIGAEPPRVTVGVRSGDTPPSERRAMLRQPPHILITTPESLFLMLTSAARETLTGIETVIVDEVHAVAGTKRGAHLAVSLERLDALLARPAQRIGLSATVRPAEEVARYLGGRAPVTIVAPASEKRFDLRVVFPSVETTDGAGAAWSKADEPVAGRGSIWPHVEEAIVDRVLEQRSTIVFANSRRLAERLTSRLNEIHQERLERSSSAPEAPAEGALLARAHHGSVSREQRAIIEDDLKSGRLRCVVATSSLELGIDMGAVDLVIQVEAPPSVASGLQRVGRAGHQVGGVSHGMVFPKHRSDLIHAAVASERMAAGLIEELTVPANPLDILAQQTIAAAALEPLDAEEWFDTVRRSAPFAGLPRSAYEATLDLLAGRYPSDEFAELRPRILWNRDSGELRGRPGAQRLAVTSGGAIPDRGLFGVFLAGETGPGRRVGELDEEMVYESRVGDVFALGATSWRILEITHDRVLVAPAFGEPGRMPFWRGDGLGRPAELGRAVGAYIREVSTASPEAAVARCEAAGLDTRATASLMAFLAEQRAATGQLPTDRTLVVERFRDELGDWRLILHSPYGMQVHAPWALAVGARVRERYGVDGACVSHDDGIVVRIPDTEDEPPGAGLFVFEPEEIEELVTEQIGGSALFAARFRECAARALLLPRQNPGKRSPLWQQRQRASQLLDVARKYPSFPIVLEAVRECLQDSYDLPALAELAHRLADRRLRIAETETDAASPFARSLLFGYVAAFMYEGDSPLAERRAAALSLDADLLAELLGRAELRELLDPAVIERVELELQRLAPDRRMPADAEGVADLLRLLGPLTPEEVAARVTPHREAGAQDAVACDSEESAGAARSLLEELVDARRAIRVGLVGGERWAAIEDAARLRDALGVPLPPGVPAAFADPVADPLGDLVGRYARTHGPFTAGEAADRLGLGVSVVLDTLRRLGGDRRVVEGEFRPGAQGTEWCDAEVLRRLRRLSLAALRQEVEPVPAGTLGRFLPSWHHVGGSLRGVDGVAAVVEQLAGVRIPASAWESLVLPARVVDYSPAMLDELTSSGEVVWAGGGSLPGGDGWVSLHPAESAPLTLPSPIDAELGELHREILGALGTGGGFFFHQLSDAVGAPDDAALASAIWELVWAGLLTNDTIAPLRVTVGGGAHRQRRAAPRSRLYRGRPSPARSAAPPTVAGRWSLLPAAAADTALRAHALAETLLDRHGVVTRGAVADEAVPGGFALVYRVLSGFEEAGRVRRGYFVDGLGAAQFAAAGTVDRLRSFVADQGREPARAALVLAATDPANPYGAALEWPGRTAESPGHRPGRRPGALVALVDGEPVLYVERGGRTVLAFADDEAVLAAAAAALAALVRQGRIVRLSVETVNGAPVLGTALGAALAAAGFTVTPRGLRMRS